MRESDLVLLPVMLPLAGAALALAAKAWKDRPWSARLEAAAAAVGLFAPVGVLFLLLPAVLGGGVSFVVGDRGYPLGIVQRFDGLSWLVDILGFTGACAAWVYSRGSGPRNPLFTTLFLIQTSALAATASCADLFNLFVCLEVLGIASYALTASSEKPAAFLAAFSYLAVSSAAMGFFLLGVFGLYRLTGSLSYSGIAAGLSALEGGPGALYAGLSLACIVAATAVRVAVLPVYGWLPDAHAAAPHPVSAVLSGVLIKTPLFALGRLMADLSGLEGPMGEILGRMLELLGLSGTATALIAVVVALSQRDAKRLLAYHSISQIGYVVGAWALGSPAAVAAAWLHAFFHALFKGLLFLSVGTATDALGNRDVYEARGAAAALRKCGDPLSLTTVCFFVGALSIAAFPPFNGYASKNAVTYLFGHSWRYAVYSLTGIGTIASMIKLSRIFFGRTSGGAPPGAYRVKAPMAGSMVFLALLCVAGGIAARPLGAFAARLLGAESNPVPAGIFSLAYLGNAALYGVAGAGLFLAASSRWGKELTHRIRSRPRSFTGLVAAFSLALFSLGVRVFY